jgi:hypothetical protein
MEVRNPDWRKERFVSVASMFVWISWYSSRDGDELDRSVLYLSNASAYSPSR